MENLKEFTSKIPDFISINSGNQIKYFVYFLQIEKHYESINSKNVNDCFNYLHINSYSNISAYLNTNSKKSKTQQFLKKKNGFVLHLSLRGKIDIELQKPIMVKPSDSLFAQSIFNKTRGYLIEYGKEASACYDYGLYNSCLFMLRKITETLLIELYESKGLQAKIKTGNGDYFQLSELIKSSTNEPSWKFTKIVKENLPTIKLLADSSIHSKRFSAKKVDIDDIKINTRITFEEIISHIDYEKWNVKT